MEALTTGVVALRLGVQVHRLQRAVKARGDAPGLIKLPRGCFAFDAQQLDAVRRWARENNVYPDQGERLVPTAGSAECLA